MVDTLEFHEFKFTLFKDQQKNARGTEDFIAEAKRRAAYNPGVRDVAKDAEKLRGMDESNTRNFIISIVVNLDYGRREAKMSSWYASPGAANYDRQLKIERCVMEFYDFCVKQGLEPLCHELGFNLSQTPLSEGQIASLNIQMNK